MMSVSNCLECGKSLTGKQRSFCSTRCKNQHFLGYGSLKKRANERKERLVAEHGGACSRCGHTALSALSFYDSNGRSLNVGINELANLNFEKLQNKVRGCLVLCRNCYEEFQNPTPLSSRPSKTSGGTPQVSRRDFSATVEMTVKKFEKALKKLGILTENKFLLAVSGGVDSIVMLDLFAKNFPIENLIVAHLNHGLRPETDNDERYVRELARSYGLEYITEKISPKEGGNLEEYFRGKRREFLLAAANDNGASFIALAHNANDQAETVLMNLVRGSGPAGLSGMKERDGQIIRPLLDISRAEIEVYAQNNHLAWVEDVTNADTSYTRNYLRHEVLPLLARINPEYLANIARSAKIQQELQTKEILASARMTERGDRNDNDFGSSRVAPLPRTIMGEELTKQNLYEVIAREYERLTGSRKDLAKTHYDQVCKLLQNPAGTKKVDLPHGVEAVSHYGTLEIRRKMSDNDEPKPGQISLNIGENTFGNWVIKAVESPHLSFRPSEASGEIPQDARRDPSSKVPPSPGYGRASGMTNKFEVRVDEETFGSLSVRSAKVGEIIDKYGIRGHKKLQDLYVDAKIDRDKRPRWPVLVDSSSDEIVWVPGLAVAKRLIPNNGNILIKVSEEAHEKETK